MKQFEYNDLNKFFVSVGIFLIGLTFMLPWLYLREKFDLEVKANDLEEFTEVAQNIIGRRQNITGWLSIIVPIISIISFLTGAFLTYIGIKGWRKLQIILEEREELINKELSAKIVQLSRTEKIEKVNQELQTQDEEIKSTPNEKTTFASKYIEAETKFYNRINLIYQDSYKISKDIRINENEYDILYRSPLKMEKDVIFELKYSESYLRGSYFFGALNQLTSSLNYYQQNIKSNAIGRLVFLMPYKALHGENKHPRSFYGKSIDLIKSENSKLTGKDIMITYFDVNKIDTYTDEEIKDKLNIKK